ncbi:hypothetical protein SBY92_002346 [Candida maltosa Xu316]
MDDASPLLQSSNGQFISPNPNTNAFTSSTTDLSGIDILDFIPPAAVAEQHQLQQQHQLQLQLQLQQYLQTPKSAMSPKFQLSGSNFSHNPTPSFGAMPIFPNNNNNNNVTSFSATVPVAAQFSPITPNVVNFGTPSSVNGLSNSPVQFSPPPGQQQRLSRSSSASTSVADKASPTIGLGVSFVDQPTTKRQPSPHEQAAFQFQQQINNEATKSQQQQQRDNTSKLQQQSDAQLQKLMEQQREKQQQQLLLLQKGEIPKPPELKPKRKSSCRPHKQKKRLQELQQQKKISPPPLQSITGDSPTTIEISSPQSDLNNDFSCFTNTTFMFGGGGGNITAEELLNSDPFDALKSGRNGDILSEFVDLEYDDSTTTGELDKSVDDSFDFLNLNNHTRPQLAATSSQTSINIVPAPAHQQQQRPLLKKKKSTSITPTKVAKRTLKKASSFSGGVVGTPQFIMNPKLQWTKSQTNEHQQRSLMNRNLSHGHTQSLSDLGVQQAMPVFTLSNHYSFVYENAETIYQDENGDEGSNTNYTPRKHTKHPSLVSEFDLLKDFESGLGEFKLEMSRKC